MNAPAPSIRLDAESDEFEVTSVVAVAPTWRDIWAILRGRYQPLVVRQSRVTFAGQARILKQVWTSEKVRDALNSPNPLLDWINEKR